MAKAIQSISSDFDFVDAPAQAVLDKNARSVAQRIVDETKEELDKVLKRVENIYDAYDYATQFQFLTPTKSTNIEHVQDIIELMNILKDDFKKKQYLQQITVFIVGFEKASVQRLRLIQQVNEFLLDTEKVFDRDFERHDEDLQNPDFNETHLATNMESSLDSCRALSERLAEVNKEMVDFLVKYAQKKQGSKNQRKLEKALDQAKQECLSLTTKLATTRDELIEKEDKLQNLLKQLEAKDGEVLKYKTSAESLKQLVGEAGNVEEQMRVKDAQMKELVKELKQTHAEMNEIKETNLKYASEIQEKGESLRLAEENLVVLRAQVENVKQEMDSHYQEMIDKLKKDHEQVAQALDAQHREELEAFKKEVAVLKEAPMAAISREETPSERLKQLSRGNTIVETGVRRPSRETSQASMSSKSKRYSSVTSKRETELDDVTDFDDAFDLNDEEKWSSVPKNHVSGRFFQYRKLSLQDRQGLLDSLKRVKGEQNEFQKQLASQLEQKTKNWNEERASLKSMVDKKIAERRKAQELAEKTLDKLEDVTQLAESIHGAQDDKSADRIRKWREKFENLKLENRQMREKLMEIQREDGNTEMVDRLISANEIHSSQSSQLSQISTLSDGAPDAQDVALSALNDVPIDPPILEAVGIQHAASPANIDNLPTVAEHPIVLHYIETYDLLLRFRFKVLKFLDECSSSVNSAGWLRSFQPLSFEKTKRVTPQTADMTKSVDALLNRTLVLIQELIRAVNSTNDKLATADTQATLEELQRDRTRLQTELNEMNKKYLQLRSQMDDSNEKYENQLNHNTSLMLEMQETIQDMRREMTDFQASVHAAPDLTNSTQNLMRHFSATQKSDSSHTPPPNPNLHFTRVQAQRNAKTLKRAYNSHRISAFLFEDALRKMEEYTELPSERLAVLVQKYLSFQAMQRLAEYIRLNRPLNERVFRLLDKVEMTIEKRNSRYEKIMDYLRQERIRRAHNLMETCDTIENGSSIFLIKPTVNQYSREMLRRAMDYLFQTQPNEVKEKDSSPPDEPTKLTSLSKNKSGLLILSPQVNKTEKDSRHSDDKSTRHSMHTEPVGETLTWNPELSSSRSIKLSNKLELINTPKLLEMDINRYLLRQSNVSSRLLPTTRANTIASPHICLPAWETEVSDVRADNSKHNSPRTEFGASKPLSRSYLAIQRTNISSSRQSTMVSFGSMVKHCTPDGEFLILGANSQHDYSNYVQNDKTNASSQPIGSPLMHEIDLENLPKRRAMAPPLPPITASPHLAERDEDDFAVHENEPNEVDDPNANPLQLKSAESVAVE